MTDLAARFLAGFGAAFQPELAVVGLAVSGGGDSLAMLHLAVDLGLKVRAVTVDHGLRPEAAAEAAEVGRICAGLGVPHEVLHWHWDKRGNLQDAARRGRRQAIAAWARQAGVTLVALGHTQDDVAETFLMRLARGAGVDGLSAMAADWQEGGVHWARPMLQISRAALRDYLTGIGVQWVDDPSNDNLRFDRVKARQAMVALRPLGLTAEGLAEVAGHLTEARLALETATDHAAARLLQAQGNAVRLDVAGLSGEAAEVQRRLILRVISYLAPTDYGPRGQAVQAMLAKVLAGDTAVLAGCRVTTSKTGTWAFREAKAVAGVRVAPDQPWDGQWMIAGPVPAGAVVAALGAGIALCPGWRDTGLPRPALLASPALWLGEHLLAAPMAGFRTGFQCQLAFPCGTVASFGVIALNRPYECLSCHPMAARPYPAWRIREFVRG